MKLSNGISLIIICSLLLSVSCKKEKYVTVKPAIYEHALNNPMKGFRPSLGSYNQKSYKYSSIKRSYIKWNELENHETDGIDKIKQVCDEKWKGLEERNIKVIPRVYLDWDSKVGNEYWPEDMKEGDYTSEQFKQRVARLVKRLGEVWDNDPRVAWVQMGIIGYWGEHHHPKPNEWQQELLGDLFTEAFKNKKVLIRRPFETFENYDFGWYWDSFAHWNQMKTQMEPMLNKHPNLWKVAPIEGEVAYNWGEYYIQPGESPDETLKNSSHRNWLINQIRNLHCTGLGWIAEYDQDDPAVAEGAEEVQKVFGYRYILNEARFSLDDSLRVAFDVTNEGSAPFYYDWPVEVALLDTAEYEPVWSSTLKTVDIRNWLPGENWIDPYRKEIEGKLEFLADSSLNSIEKGNWENPPKINTVEETFNVDVPPRTYILSLAILDPAGNLPSLRFATVNYLNGGRHPIGLVNIKNQKCYQLPNDFSFDDPGLDNSLHYRLNENQ